MLENSNQIKNQAENLNVPVQLNDRATVQAQTKAASEPKVKAAVEGEGKAEIDQAHIQEVANRLNEAVGRLDSNVSVSVDKDTGMVVVRIKDAQTGEVVKQIPPQQLLDVDASMENIIGLLVNDKA